MTPIQMFINPFKNPITKMGIRRRLRRKNLITNASVTLTLLSFLYMIIYLTLTQRDYTSTALAAKYAFVPILVFQAFVLMFMGTGAVASAIAEEKESGRLDYQRMTPMNPLAKILGYLYGLPCREYYMFFLTLPFMAFSVIAGGISIYSVLQLYLVMFTSVTLYHMTGMVAGMLAKRPRRASWFARIMVVMLYMFLPTLSQFGFSFLSYFTITPVFTGIVASELPGQATQNIALYREVAFFNVTISPTLYTILMQGILLVTFFVIVYRKMRDPNEHALPKHYSVGFYLLFQALVVGSLWPMLSGSDPTGMMTRLSSGDFKAAGYLVVGAFYFALSMGVALMLTIIVTPSQHLFLAGLRRATKYRRSGIDVTSDAASGTLFAVLISLITLVGFVTLAIVARGTPQMFGTLPSLGSQALFLVLWIGILFCVQSALELWGIRKLMMLCGFIWIVPSLVAMVIASVWSLFVPAAYLAITNPFAQFVYLFAYVFNPGSDDLGSHVPILAFGSLAIIVTSAVIFFVVLKKRQIVLRRVADRVSGA